MISKTSSSVSIRDGTKTDKVASVKGSNDKAKLLTTDSTTNEILLDIAESLSDIKDMLTLVMESKK